MLSSSFSADLEKKKIDASEGITQDPIKHQTFHSSHMVWGNWVKRGTEITNSVCENENLKTYLLCVALLRETLNNIVECWLIIHVNEQTVTKTYWQQFSFLYKKSQALSHIYKNIKIQALNKNTNSSNIMLLLFCTRELLLNM